MEMKRINENTMRVILGADDLEDRGITMLDLLGNQGQIESFFYSILEEVDQDHMFAKSDAVTFQVMPNTNGLELLISKAGIPSVSAKNDEKQNSNLTRQEILQGLDAMSTENEPEERMTEIKPAQPDVTRVYVFTDFEAVVALAQELKVTGLSSALRTYQQDYFLELAFLEENFVEMKPDDAWVIANEFGEQIGSEYLEFREQAKVLFEQDALENLRFYFK